MFQNTACLVHAAGKHGLVLLGTSRSNTYKPSRYDKLIYSNGLYFIINRAHCYLQDHKRLDSQVGDSCGEDDRH